MYISFKKGAPKLVYWLVFWCDLKYFCIQLCLLMFHKVPSTVPDQRLPNALKLFQQAIYSVLLSSLMIEGYLVESLVLGVSLLLCPEQTKLNTNQSFFFFQSQLWYTVKWFYLKSSNHLVISQALDLWPLLTTVLLNCPLRDLKKKTQCVTVSHVNYLNEHYPVVLILICSVTPCGSLITGFPILSSHGCMNVPRAEQYHQYQ